MRRNTHTTAMGLQAALLNACAGTRPGARHWARKAIRDHRPHRVRSAQDRHRHDDGGGGRRLAQTGTASTRPRRPRARSSTLRAIAGLVLGALALTAGTSGAAHAQEPPITVRFEKDFHQYGEASRSGRITLEARTAANVAPTENFTLTVFTEDANTEMPVLGTPTALAGSDFTAFRRTYTFRPWEFALEAGQYVVRKLVQLQITDDDVVEKNESFGVVIERTGLPAHVTLHSIKFSAALVIINDEDDTQISASAPRTVTEGESYDYVLTVDKEVAFPFQVVISTVDITASPTEGDYVHFTNVFEFEPYQRRLVRRVRTRADTRIESNEQLGVHVTGNGLDASIHLPDDQTTVTTIIDATTPDWSVTHTPAQGATTTVTEDRGTWRMTVDSGGVTWPTDQTIRLDLTEAAATADGCAAGAVHGEDFEVSDDSGLTGHASDTLILRAGRTRVTATFAIVDDAHYEPPESVIVTAHHETRRIAAPHVVTILDDQTRARLQDATVDGRTATLTFDTPMGRLTPRTDPGDVHYVERPNPPGHFFTLFEGNDEPTDEAIGVSTYRVRYGTLASTFALSGPTVTLTFPHAVRTTTKAWIRYDRFAAYAPLGPTTESLRCTNGRPRHAAASFITELDGTANTGGTATLPALTITGGEGREGTNSHIAFTVRLNPASTETVAVDYKTVSRTATEGEDFTRTRGTLEFAPGERTKTVRVPITDDTVEDDGETFLLDLYDVSGATLDTPSHATGTIRNSEDAPTGNEHTLTASFSNVPAEHGGPGEANRFTFDLTFSEAPDVSYRTLRDHHAFTINGGQVKKARRKVQRSNQSWTITIEPQGWGTINIALPGGRACTASNAICTSDNRPLSNSPNATIIGPAALSVADATANENSDAGLSFTVSLDRVSTLTVTVDYATSDGTATAGEDYTAASGTLTFNPGDAAKAINVPVLDDAIDDGGETVTLTLSNATNARIADGTATGTIENSDPLQREWIARFGRTVASDVVDGIAERLENPRGASEVRVAGLTVDRAASALGESSDGASNASTEERTFRDVVLASSFQLQGGRDTTGAASWGAWGRFSTSSFDGKANTLSFSGDVVTGLLGADVSTGEWTAGLAVSSAKGNGPYQMDDANQSGCMSGRVDSTLTSLHPYARLNLTERLSTWAIAGYGTGEMSIDPDGCNSHTTDIDMTMGAVGLRGALLDTAAGDALDMALRTDALWVRTTSKRTDGLAPAEASVKRLRVMLEGGMPVTVANGTLTPTLTAGLRHDSGDAEQGAGIELGAGLAYQDKGLRIAGNVRTLASHADEHYDEWGASFAVKVNPGNDGRGLSLSITPTWGNTANEAGQLWTTRTADELARAEPFDAGRRIDAELGYGIQGPSGIGTLTPYGGFSLANDAGRTLRTGLRWNASQQATVGLEGTHETHADGNAPTTSIMLRGAIRW